jgi:hypothetical protein
MIAVDAIYIYLTIYASFNLLILLALVEETIEKLAISILNHRHE